MSKDYDCGDTIRGRQPQVYSTSSLKANSRMVRSNFKFNVSGASRAHIMMGDLKSVTNYGRLPGFGNQADFKSHHGR